MPPDHRRLLHDVARRVIASGAGGECVPDVGDYPPALREPAATFVTLHCGGRLQGCIGSLRPQRPLVCDVAHNAYHAAFHDPRFAPVDPALLEGLDIHIAALSPLVALEFTCEADLLGQLRIGIDGLVIEEHGRTATFLPVMWQRLVDPVTFLRALKDKAGLSPEYWSPTLCAARYTTEDV